MNIKTTILLLVLLIGVGAYVFFSQGQKRARAKPVVHTLVDVKSSDVTRFTIDRQRWQKDCGAEIDRCQRATGVEADSIR